MTDSIDSTASTNSTATGVAATRPGALSDAAVWFSQNFRFAAGSGIGRLAADINAARADEAIAWLNATAADGRHAATAADRTGLHTLLREGYADYFATVMHDPFDVGAITQAFDRFRVLCAVQQGRDGVVAINAWLASHARALMQTTPRMAGLNATASEWYVGRPIMVTRNDYVLKLFNGDVGIALPDASGALMVMFPQSDGSFRAVAPARLPAARTAYAITAHKAQGSEFDHVLVVLPQQPSRVVTRELLYTAVTRARLRVSLCATEMALRVGIAAASQRESGLLARLREAG